MDMEFVQFHPTVLNAGESPLFLISETVRGEGGVLRNIRGEAFMKGRHALGDLAPRDVVSRWIVKEQKKGSVYLVITHRNEGYLRRRFPTIFQRCLKVDINMAEDPIPVSPAAHYMCGGVKINVYGETSVPGLYAFGECSCSGVHGANRMASNSILECLAFTTFAFKRITRAKLRPRELVAAGGVELLDVLGLNRLRSRFQDIMAETQEAAGARLRRGAG